MAGSLKKELFFTASLRHSFISIAVASLEFIFKQIFRLLDACATCSKYHGHSQRIYFSFEPNFFFFLYKYGDPSAAECVYMTAVTSNVASQ